MGLINALKYPYTYFLEDLPTFISTYEEYLELTDKPFNFETWLIMNTFGILQDTQMSLLQNKSTGQNYQMKKDTFLNVVKQGDILISSANRKWGSIGHAAIMVTDNQVLEMPGYIRNKMKKVGYAKNNNRKIIKDIWYELHNHDWITVYRCPDAAAANAAADWAYRNYYNPTCGTIKAVNITYKITLNLLSKNPSYCSKLVLHAYYFGTTMINQKKLWKYQFIFPLSLPKYFKKLKNMGSY